MLAPVSEALSVEGLQLLMNPVADDQVDQRLDELGSKANEGKLSDEERREYELYIQVGNVLAILQAQARMRLKKAGLAA